MSEDQKRGDPLKPVEIEGFGRPEDSRLKGYRGKITHPTLPLERTFCTKCGEPFGWVSTESYAFIEAGEVIVLCNKCEAEITKIGGSVPLKAAAPDNATEIPPLRRGSLPSRLGE